MSANGESDRKRKSSPNWLDYDVGVLLDAIEKVMPLGSNGWEKVSQLFNLDESILIARNDEQCKRKFVALKNHRKPTGDSDCPLNVVRAKRLQRALDNYGAVVRLAMDEESRLDYQDDENEEATIATYDGDNSESVVEPLNSGSAVVATDLGNSDAKVSGKLLSRATSSSNLEKPNRTGRSLEELRLLSSSLASQTPPSGFSLSYTAKRRQNLDQMIDRAEQSMSGGGDIAHMVITMEERAQKRKEERDERERLREEQRRREREEREERELQREESKRRRSEEREERERIRQEEKEERNLRYLRLEEERRSRLEQMQMAIMTKIFGDIAKGKDSPDRV
ncbi:hypothetical protein AC1031_001213 [Aphanomyces cochlioides]|nr:hypothetical protein AC1031_001213 [Aphanomyces cochlioides]